MGSGDGDQQDTALCSSEILQAQILLAVLWNTIIYCIECQKIITEGWSCECIIVCVSEEDLDTQTQLHNQIGVLLPKISSR